MDKSECATFGKPGKYNIYFYMGQHAHRGYYTPNVSPVVRSDLLRVSVVVLGSLISNELSIQSLGVDCSEGIFSFRILSARLRGRRTLNSTFHVRTSGRRRHLSGPRTYCPLLLGFLFPFRVDAAVVISVPCRWPFLLF